MNCFLFTQQLFVFPDTSGITGMHLKSACETCKIGILKNDALLFFIKTFH